ncbi:MAG TPA: amidohydrolase family protein [Bryobacteraceae bacterium]|nr:amidohydrolase family protein [Bryobacteraceae bacterium]
MKASLLIVLLGTSAAWAQTMSIEEYEPESTLVVPERRVTRAKFPFIDVHNHQRGATPEAADRLIKEMDALNMRTMVNLSGGYGDRLKSGVAALKGRHPQRFVVFANIDFSGIDDPDYGARAARQLREDVRNGAQGLKIFKNFGMDLKDGKGQRIRVDDPRFDPVFRACTELKIPVLIHTGEPRALFDPMDRYNERWLELKLYPGRGRPPERYPTFDSLMTEQQNLFARHRGTTFIDAHLGWYGNDLGKLGKLLDALPNVYTEISAVVEELGRQPRFARAWFERYQDRVMFGKDTWRPAEYHTYFRILETADEYFDHDRKYHGTWKVYGLDLPDQILKKLYYKNALRVVPGIAPEGFPK